MTATTTPGSTLRESRQTAKMSQGALADAIGVVQPMISLWERDERRPTLSDALALKGAIGLDARVWGYSDEDIARVAAAFATPSAPPPAGDATATAIDGTPTLRSERVRESKTARRRGSAAA